MVGQETRRGHDLRRVYTKLGAEHFAEPAEASDSSPRPRSTVDRVGDIDFPSWVAWAIERHNPMLA